MCRVFFCNVTNNRRSVLLTGVHINSISRLWSHSGVLLHLHLLFPTTSSPIFLSFSSLPPHPQPFSPSSHLYSLPPSRSEACWEMCQCIRACSSSSSMALYSNMDWGEAGRAVTAVNSVHKGQCTALGPDTVMRRRWWNKTGLKIKIH